MNITDGQTLESQTACSSNERTVIMAKTLTAAGLALAATGFALTPASAAPAMHSNVSVSTYAPASVQVEDTSAHHRRWHRGGHGNRGKDYRGDYGRYPSGYDNQPYYMRYPSNYGEPVRRDTRVWRGDDGRYYCRRDNGTTGLLVGAGVGALIGHEVAGRGDRTLGAILGGAAGALLGRTIDRSSTRCG